MQITNTPLEAEIERMYWDGLLDKDIAKAIGCTKSTICVWRGRKDFPPNDVQGRKSYKLYKIMLRKTGAIIAHGSMSECVKQMGKPENTVRSIVTKVKRGLLKKYVVEVYEVYGG